MERFTDKMARVTENLQAMAGMGAPQEDVNAYLETEGTDWAQVRQYESIKAAPVEKPGAMARLGRGFMDVGQGVEQITGNMTPEEQAQATQELNTYEQAVGPGMDWMRVGGQALATAPLAAIPGAGASAGILARTGAGALAGGASGGLLFARDEGERLTNVAGGVIGGGVAGAAMPAITKAAGVAVGGAKRAVGAVSGLLTGKFEGTISRSIKETAESAGINLDELGEAYVKRVALKAKEALKAGQPFDYEAEMRAARAAKFGFDGESGLLRGQATRDPATYSRQLNLSKRPEGAPIAERMNNQLAQAEAYMDDLAKVPDLDPVEASDGLRLLAKARADAMQADVSSAYKAVPKGGTFPVDSLQSRTGEILTDFEDKVSSGVKARIKSFADGKREPTMDELIKLDKLISDTMPPGEDAAVNTATERLKKAVLGVMDDAAESEADPAVKEAYKAAKAAAKARFDKIGPQGGLVSQLVHGKIDPSQIPNKIMNGKIDDLRRLKTFIMSEAERGPVNRWETIKRMVEKQIQDQARPGGQFSQAAYDRAISKIGKNRLNEIFGEARAKELFEFRDVARDLFRYPNFHTVNTSNTASAGEAIARDALGSLANSVPGGQLAAGLLSRSANKKAEKETAKIVLGLLGTQPPMAPMANPAMRLLPYAGASAGLGGLAGASKLRR